MAGWRWEGLGGGGKARWRWEGLGGGGRDLERDETM